MAEEEEFEIYFYVCANDDCSLQGWRVAIFRGEEPVCPECGWMMNASYPEIEGLA